MRRAVACALMIILMGCTREDAQPNTNGTGSGPTSTSSASPTSTMTDDERAAGVQASAAYVALQRTYDRAALTADYRNVVIDKYAGDPARRQLHRYLLGMARSGIVQVVRGGQPTYAPVVVSVNLAATPAQVVLRDCPDSRDVFAVFKSNGESAEPTGAPYQPHRKHPVTATLRRYSGRWLVVKLGGSREATC
jgi:hypothetical protein